MNRVNVPHSRQRGHCHCAPAILIPIFEEAPYGSWLSTSYGRSMDYVRTVKLMGCSSETIKLQGIAVVVQCARHPCPEAVPPLELNVKAAVRFYLTALPVG